MSSSTTTNTSLPAPVILEATSGTTGIDIIEVDKLGISGATLEIQTSNGVKSGDRVRAWSSGNGVIIIDEIKTVESGANPLTFSIAKEKLKKGNYPTFFYLLLNDKDELIAVSDAVPYSIV